MLPRLRIFSQPLGLSSKPPGGILAEFRKARLRLVDCVQEKAPTLFGRSLLHPRLKKPMRLVGRLYFAAEHDDHHLAWIWELIDAH